MDRESPIWYILLCFFTINTTLILAAEWDCEILPSERRIESDTSSGAEVIYVTTHPAQDQNLYFHDRCWLFDNQMMLFFSDRSGRQEIYGYVTETGELVRLNPGHLSAASHPVASKDGRRVFVIRDNAIYVWTLELSTESGTKVTVAARRLCDLPSACRQFAGLNENSDQTRISFGYAINSTSHIVVADVSSGETDIVAKLNFPIQHIQFHWHRPDVLSFARSYGNDTAPVNPEEPRHARIWFVNHNTKTPVPAFYQKPGELVTHECWWVNDQITFVGGHRPEEAHVKVLDLKTGDIRIIGAGAWWQGGSAKEVSGVNWWHAAGSPDGRWVAADNWHGVIALFDAKTTEMRILTQDHRVYGGGAHPHVGWDLTGERVQFTSNKNGNPDVCLAVIPQDW
jgi:hypothetical protein